MKRSGTGSQAQMVLLERTVRGLEEDNTRLASMYEQLSKSNDSTHHIAPNQAFEAAKSEDRKQQAAKKGWQTVTDDFGGYSRSPGSANTMARKDEGPIKGTQDVTIKRTN